jgi:hypothetical protein
MESRLDLEGSANNSQCTRGGQVQGLCPRFFFLSTLVPNFYSLSMKPHTKKLSFQVT